MKIKISDTKNPLIEYTAGLLSRFFKTHRRQFISVILIGYSLLVFIGGVLVHKTGVIEEKIKPAIKQRRVFLKHLARGIFLARPQHITIDIAHKDFQRLEYKRREALELNKLIVEDTDFVPANIRHNGNNLAVRLRLKGDHTDHLEGDKWSFRIKARGDNTLFGMKQFSIQHPKTRNYIYEWLYHEALKREGLPHLMYDFIKVTLNGKDRGIYALEEFFEKRLIENSGYREGPIIRFDETAMWDELLQRGAVVNSGTYLSSAIDAFQTNRTLGDPVLRRQFIKAVGMLESFRRGDLKASNVFDAVALAKFFAVTDLMGAHHATIWINMRFYFNPVTAKLEPIGFDGNAGTPIEGLCLYSDDAYIGGRREGAIQSFYRALLSDREFYRRYVEELERVSSPDYLENFFKEVGAELENKLNILYREFPYYSFSKDVFDHNRHVIGGTLNPVRVLHAYFKYADTDSINIEIGNVQSMDAEVLGILHRGSMLLRPSEQVVLPGKTASQPVEYRNIRFLFPEGFTWEEGDAADLKVHCRIYGTKSDRYENVFPYAHMDKTYIERDFSERNSNVGEFDFVVIDKETGKIIFLPGEWAIDNDLIIPQGFIVICSEATKINLSNNANIISYSPLQFTGTRENPILVYSSDSTGQGLAVMADSRGSILKNVVFRNLAAPQRPGWELTGAVTFYESPLEIYGCEFSDSRSEDALNIIRSEFRIDDSVFLAARSDGFDGDFVKGRIANSSFLHCGNDGIDISGSVVGIDNVVIESAGDKGISVGETSKANIRKAKIKNSNIAVASKDASAVEMEDSEISDCSVGFAVYQKKPEYGPAAINVSSSRFKGLEKDYLIEKGSKAVIDNIDIKADKEKVYELLYGKE